MDIGRTLSYVQAVKEVYVGRNVFTVMGAEAEVVARVANSNKKLQDWKLIRIKVG
mgnify:CR=1 FL=1